MTSKASGFTLVELAIVLMIIGLLIGGILKGQELIENARTISLIRQVKSYESAVLAFKDSYGVLPGDITNPATRLPNCTGYFCTTPGDGNGLINLPIEQWSFWVHLAKANLISGINADAMDYADTMPDSPFGGVILIQHKTFFNNTPYYRVAGPYLMLFTETNTWTPILTAHRTAMIDRKMDDSIPYTGDVLAYDGTACIAGGIYNEAGEGTICYVEMLLHF